VFTYRVTKYDPCERDRGGAYRKEEWTSVSDVGRTFGGSTLSEQDYLWTEDAYVQAVKSLLAESMVRSMRVTDLEAHYSGQDVRIDDDVLDECRKVRNNSIVSGRLLEFVVRGCLREYIWCRLSGSKESYVHFGYDYYMYVGVPKPAGELILPVGVYLEDCESPYKMLD
jgi:hypothetical protein